MNDSGSTKSIADALRMAIRQNSHDMVMTGDEIRHCETALAAQPDEPAAAHPMTARQRDAIERAAGASQQIVPDEPSVWQPIETAPKDGTEIMVADARHGTVGLAEWYMDSWHIPDTEGGAWIAPTHWMPRPNAPTKVENDHGI